MNQGTRYALGMTIATAISYVAGIFGVSLHAVGGVASLAWMPTAIGLALVLIYGLSWWPVVAISTLLVFTTRGASVAPSLIVTAIDVLEVCAGFVALRLLNFRIQLDRVRDVVAFVEVSFATSLLSATASVSALYALGVVEDTRLTMLWSTWWWSHLSADLIVVPAILTCLRKPGTPRVKHSAQHVEAVALTLTVVIVVLVVLGRWLPPWLPISQAPYYLLPFLLWAGIRFGPRGAALASFGAASIAIIAQAFGLAPFERISDLRSFIAVSTVSTLLLSALAMERVRAVERKGAIQIASLDAIVSVDERGHLVEMNPAAERMFGLREADMIGKDLASHVLPPRLRGMFHRGLRAIVRNEPGSVLDTRYRTTAWRAADNREFPVEVAVSRPPVETQFVLTGFIRDLSAEREAEAALREAHDQLERKVEERTAALVEANDELERRATLMRQAEDLAHLGSFDYDFEHNRLKWSDELYRIYGRDMRTFEPTFEQFIDAIHPDDRSQLKERLERAKADVTPFEFEERVLRPDGTLRVLQTLARVLVDETGRPVRLVGCCQDITERKRIEAVKARLVQLVESSDDAIIGLSPTGTIESWNAAAAKLFGYDACDIVGRPFDILLPGTSQGRLQELFDAIRSGEHVARYELQHQRRDGSLFDASVTTSAVLDKAGHVVGLSKVLRDVTNQKRVEMALRASLREKEVLLREIHHRVKNNLQVIASMLNIQLATEQDLEAHKSLLESQARIQSMALVHQLLYQSEDLAQIDIGQYLKNLTQKLAETYNVRPDRIEVAVSAPVLLLDIDRSIPCGLIVNELVTNALNHAFPDQRKGRICVTLDLREEQVLLTVADNGIGMPRGFRIEDATTFGLRIARTLTHQLDGTIAVTGDGGTVARITFPLGGRPLPS